MLNYSIKRRINRINGKIVIIMIDLIYNAINFILYYKNNYWGLKYIEIRGSIIILIVKENEQV
jgi:hypothetical protein